MSLDFFFKVSPSLLKPICIPLCFYLQSFLKVFDSSFHHVIFFLYMFFGLELKEIAEKSKSSKLLSIFAIIYLCFSLVYQLSGSHGVSNFLARFFLFDQQNSFWAFFPNDRVQKDCWNNWYLSRNYFEIWSRCFFYKIISIFDEIFWIYLLTFLDRWSFDFSVSIFLSKSYSQLLSYC